MLSKNSNWGFTIRNYYEPDFTIVENKGSFYVCMRKSRDFKAVLADFKDKKHADYFLTALCENKVSTDE